MINNIQDDWGLFVDIENYNGEMMKTNKNLYKYNKNTHIKKICKKCIIDLMNKNEIYDTNEIEIYDTNEIEIYDTNEIEIYDTNKNVSKFIIRVTSATVLFIISCIVFSTL